MDERANKKAILKEVKEVADIRNVLVPVSIQRYRVVRKE